MRPRFVRTPVPVGTTSSTVGDVYRLPDGAVLRRSLCPICHQPLGSEPLVLVYIGTDVEETRDVVMDGVCLPVHAICTDMPTRKDTSSEEIPVSADDGCLHMGDVGV